MRKDRKENMETSSENIKTENSETLSFPENEKRETRSQYTLNGIVLFLSENLGRAIGKLTRESERILSKVRQKTIVGAKEAGERAKGSKTKASKTGFEDIPVSRTNEISEAEEKAKEDTPKASTDGIEGVPLNGKDEALNSKEVNTEAKGAQSDAGEGLEKEKESQETPTSKQDASSETEATTTSTEGQKRKSKSKDEGPASDGEADNPPSDEEE